MQRRLPERTLEPRGAKAELMGLALRRCRPGRLPHEPLWAKAHVVAHATSAGGAG